MSTHMTIDDLLNLRREAQRRIADTINTEMARFRGLGLAAELTVTGIDVSTFDGPAHVYEVRVRLDI